MTEQYLCDRCRKAVEWDEIAVEIDDMRGVRSHGVHPHRLDGHLCHQCADDHDVDIYEALFGSKPET